MCWRRRSAFEGDKKHTHNAENGKQHRRDEDEISLPGPGDEAQKRERQGPLDNDTGQEIENAAGNFELRKG